MEYTEKELGLLLQRLLEIANYNRENGKYNEAEKLKTKIEYYIKGLNHNIPNEWIPYLNKIREEIYL